MNNKDDSTAYGMIATGLIIPLFFVLLKNKSAEYSLIFSFATTTTIWILYLPVLLTGIILLVRKSKTTGGTSSKNLYFEYRKWNLFWGFFIDSRYEVQKVLNHYNDHDWKVVEFEWSKLPNMHILRLLLVLYITIITLGFVSYWYGFIIVFEGSNSKTDDFVNKQNEITDSNSFRDWSIINPSKSINEYYSEINKNRS